MSLTAGYDLLVEVNADTVDRLVKANLKIGGQPVTPPFDLTVPVNQGGVSGSAHLIVGAVHTVLSGDHDLSVEIDFTNTTVAISSPVSVTLTTLEGVITVDAPLRFVATGNGNEQALAFDLGSAKTTVAFSAPSQTKITQGVGPLGQNAASFTQLASQVIGAYFQGMGVVTFPVAFDVVPGVNGSLGPPLQFEQLEVHHIGGQALGICGILLVAHHNQGVPSSKNTTSITGGHNVCLSVSASAFHSLIFCPQVANALKTTIASLPTSCGGAGSFTTQGVDLKSLTDGFANGHVDVNGSLSKSGTCYDAHGSFHATITFTVQQGKLVPHVATDSPDVDVDIPWYCWLAAGVVLGPLGLVIVAVVNAIANSVVDSLAQSALGGMLGKAVSGVGLSAFQGATFDAVMVTPEGLSLEGNVNVVVPAGGVPGLTLNGSVVLLTSTEVGTGTYVEPSGCMAGSYPYTESAQLQSGTYEPVAKLLGTPLTLEWRLEYWQGYWGYNSSPQLVSSAPLTGTSGTAVLSGVKTQYPTPLPGGTEVTQSVSITYAINGSTVTLENDPAQGSYAASLVCRATDPTNQVKEASATLGFAGHVVAIGGDYQSKLASCMAAFLAELSKVRYKDPELVPGWVPVDYPVPDDLLQVIRALATDPTPEGAEAMAHAKLGHGASWNRVLTSPEASTQGLNAGLRELETAGDRVGSA